MEIEIQTLNQGEAIISTIGIPFPVSTRTHYYEDYTAGFNKDPKKEYPGWTGLRLLQIQSGNLFS